MACVDFEARVERQAEAWMDEADRRYLKGLYTQEEYNAEVKSINQWVKRVMADPYGAIA